MSDAMLGPVVGVLGASEKPGHRSIFSVALIVALIASVVLLGLAVYYGIIFFVSESFPRPLSLGISLLLVVLAVILTTVAVLAYRQDRLMHVTVHHHGMVLGQSWFRTEQLLWNDVELLSPPNPGDSPPRFHVVLRSGRRILVPRLCVEARSDHHGRVLHHPDVQFVIDHYLGWRARHGLR